MKATIFLILISIITTGCTENTSLFNETLLLAQQGDAIAQYHIGMFYNNGIGTAKNSKLAFDWFKKSSSNHDPLGAYKLGCYYSGQGQAFMKVDHDKALEHKLVAAKAGYSLAQYDVASIVLHDNITESIKWLKRAANQGDFDALYALAHLYYSGEKLPKDATSAYLYLKLAVVVSTTEPPAKVKAILDELISDILPSERAKTDAYISAWSPKPTKLTIRAKNGLQEAEEHIIQMKKRT